MGLRLYTGSLPVFHWLIKFVRSLDTCSRLLTSVVYFSYVRLAIGLSDVYIKYHG